MRKSDKKIENNLRKALTEICENTLQDIKGYQWVSHSVNYERFPNSLIITCYFDNKQNADDAQQQGELLSLINQKLQSISVNLNNPNKQICVKVE